MIFNRTQADVDAAKKIRAEKVQNFETLTDEEKNTLERGLLTINTLNRIEVMQATLPNIFNGMGYWNIQIENESWDETQIFDVDDFQRIIDNTNLLRGAFLVYSHTPDTPPVSYYYVDINSLEKILNDLDLMINDIKSYYAECGNYYCGEE